jgi:hypothetical protein
VDAEEGKFLPEFFLLVWHAGYSARGLGYDGITIEQGWSARYSQPVQPDSPGRKVTGGHIKKDHSVWNSQGVGTAGQVDCLELADKRVSSAVADRFASHSVGEYILSSFRPYMIPASYGCDQAADLQFVGINIVGEYHYI